MTEDQKPLCITSETEEKICYYAVSDGMGGQNAGEVASGICAERHGSSDGSCLPFMKTHAHLNMKAPA